ncbi:hypothetical protein TNCT_415991, partial [Trichonephila clavata]
VLIRVQGICSNGELLCADGSKCISQSSVCDGAKDCWDGSDELGCGSCSNGQFRCTEKNQCIDSSSICNGEKDCRDGLDETFCYPCAVEEFRCADRNKCIDFSSVCNVDKDCPDSSDEVNCAVAPSLKTVTVLVICTSVQRRRRHLYHPTPPQGSADIRFFRERFRFEIGCPVYSPEHEWQHHTVECLLLSSSPDSNSLLNISSSHCKAAPETGEFILFVCEPR